MRCQPARFCKGAIAAAGGPPVSRAEPPDAVPSAASGFSLIEVLIATAILLVIVMLVSMVFQQQSGAFQAGADRVKGQTVIRNVVGMVSRDLAMAVDSDDYEGAPRNAFSRGSIAFLTFGGEAGKSASGNDSPDVLPLQRVTYSSSGTRTVADVKFSGGKWTVGASAPSAQIAGSELRNLSFYAIEGDSPTYPRAVTIHAEVKSDARAAYVSGHSAGPDGRYDESSDGDDIFVGGRPNE